MDTLPDLAAQLTATTHLPPAARYHALRELAPHLKTAIAAEQDAAVAAICDTTTYDDAATQLGVTTSEVNRRMTAHRKRIGAEPRRGRKPANPT
ncbi:hypothetical protein ABZ949_02210 [Micromonospora tulbaghiae]|uniref:hypothetical protein n=1 Tax=Micromonospora tulbaghiae TaxID=479978 RepID=UPI0033CBC5A2